MLKKFTLIRRKVQINSRQLPPKNFKTQLNIFHDFSRITFIFKYLQGLEFVTFKFKYFQGLSKTSGYPVA